MRLLSYYLPHLIIFQALDRASKKVLVPGAGLGRQVFSFNTHDAVLQITLFNSFGIWHVSATVYNQTTTQSCYCSCLLVLIAEGPFSLTETKGIITQELLEGVFTFLLRAMIENFSLIYAVMHALPGTSYLVILLFLYFLILLSSDLSIRFLLNFF